MLKSITFFVNHKPLHTLSFGLSILLLISILPPNLTFATLKKEEPGKISLYYFSTRIPPNPQNIGEQHNWFGDDTYLDINKLTKTPMSEWNERTVVIFVHGWEESEDIGVFGQALRKDISSFWL